MSTTKRKRRFQRPAEIDVLELLLCGPLCLNEAENAEAERRLERGPAIQLVRWRAERARLAAESQAK